MPSDYKPASAPVQSAPPTKTETPKPAPAPEPTPIYRSPAPTVSDNKASLADQAAKYLDKDDEPSDADEISSFEDISERVERYTVTAARQEVKTMGPPSMKEPEQAKPAVAPEPAPTPAVAAVKTSAAPPQPSPAGQGGSTAPPSAAAAAAGGIKDSLADIKTTLEKQNQVLADQTEKIAMLMQEVGTLKGKLNGQPSDREKDERIRELELELEEARS